jgi:hypothetical protein
MKTNLMFIKHNVLLREFVSFFLNEYGEKKVRDISKKVHTSNRVQKLFKQAREINAPLGTDDYLGTIHSILAFTFAKPETISFASVILLSKWENEVGSPLGIADEEYLNKMFFRILEKCNSFKTNLSGQPNFFNRFFTYLRSRQKLC